jgi:hypothetical protein
MSFFFELIVLIAFGIMSTELLYLTYSGQQFSIKKNIIFLFSCNFNSLLIYYIFFLQNAFLYKYNSIQYNSRWTIIMEERLNCTQSYKISNTVGIPTSTNCAPAWSKW